MRIIVSVHEAYLLLSTLIQPPHHALPLKRNRHGLQEYVKIQFVIYEKQNSLIYIYNKYSK